MLVTLLFFVSYHPHRNQNLKLCFPNMDLVEVKQKFKEKTEAIEEG